MEMTLNIPDDLMRALKRRAESQRRQMNETAVDAIRAGLESRAAEAAPSTVEHDVEPGQGRLQPARLTTDPVTGLPVVLGDPSLPPPKPMTAQEFANFVADLELEAELERYNASLRR